MLTSSSSLIEDRAAMADAIPAFLAWTRDWTTSDKGHFGLVSIYQISNNPQPSTLEMMKLRVSMVKKVARGGCEGGK